MPENPPVHSLNELFRRVRIWEEGILCSSYALIIRIQKVSLKRYTLISIKRPPFSPS
jgi:hypothetical protein